MNTKIYFFLGVIFPFFALAQNKTIYVSASANGLNDGSSWQNAFTNLQNALQKAQKSDALWIAKGTYFPTQNTDRTISFDLKNGVHVFGGFQGNETSLSQRDFDKNKTILSGNIGNPKDSLDNVYRVVSAMDISTPTFLDGVEITGGRADTDLFLTSKDKGLNGGGLCVAVTNASALSKITVRNCKFYNNYAGLRGGGLYFDSQYSGNIAIVVKNCHFYNNIAFFGAGMAIGDADPSTMLVDSCSFVHNQGLLFTAGLYIEVSVGKGFVANIKNCLFRENWSKLSTEGISMSQTCLIPNSVFYMDFNNCTFDREVNNYDIIYTFSGPPDSRIDAKFTKCKFMNFYDGVINISGNLSIDQCLFYKIKYNCIQQGNLIQLDNSIFYETGGVINYYKNSSITNFKNNIFVKNKHLFGKIIAKER